MTMDKGKQYIFKFINKYKNAENLLKFMGYVNYVIEIVGTYT